MTEQMLADAFAQGQLRSSELRQAEIAGRALVYGFARNECRRFPRLSVTEAEAVLDIFIGGITRIAGT
jgi:hypothetical protein